MLFNSTDKWWGDQGKRDKPHEGLDLCLYKDREDKILRLGENAKVPVIYDGIVVGIVDDFLGKSVIIEHLFSGSKAETGLNYKFLFYLIYDKSLFCP